MKASSGRSSPPAPFSSSPSSPRRPATGNLASARSLFHGGIAIADAAHRLRVATCLGPASCRGRSGPARPDDRCDRALELGGGPSLPSPGALWRERPGLRQGHRLLSLLAAGLCRAQELAAAAPVLQRRPGRRGLLGAG